MGFGAEGVVKSVNDSSVVVEFPRQFRELERRLSNQGRVQMENGGPDGKFTAEMRGC
jgi:hypothetical protein